MSLVFEIKKNVQNAICLFNRCPVKGYFVCFIQKDFIVLLYFVLFSVHCLQCLPSFLICTSTCSLLRCLQFVWPDFIWLTCARLSSACLFAYSCSSTCSRPSPLTSVDKTKHNDSDEHWTLEWFPAFAIADNQAPAPPFIVLLCWNKSGETSEMRPEN